MSTFNLVWQTRHQVNRFLVGLGLSICFRVQIQVILAPWIQRHRTATAAKDLGTVNQSCGLELTMQPRVWCVVVLSNSMHISIGIGLFPKGIPSPLVIDYFTFVQVRRALFSTRRLERLDGFEDDVMIECVVNVWSVLFDLNGMIVFVASHHRQLLNLYRS